MYFSTMKSRIKYFASTERVVERLKLYGVKGKNIFFTGYPLPLENTGSEKLEILKNDLKERLLNLDPEKRFKGKCYSVSISAVERELIGGGYGLKMYLTIINDVDYLISSTVLYAGSLRMWKDVLPKYVNVWVEFDYKSDPELVIPGKRYKLDNVQDFIASSNHNKLKSK